MMNIILSNLRFFAYHGVLEQENRVGHYFVVSLKLTTDFSLAVMSDKVKDTVNYAEVYEIVKAEMEIPSKLMEHLAGRIVKQIFSHFQPVNSIYIKIMKENPPINADCEGCGVELTVKR